MLECVSRALSCMTVRAVRLAVNCWSARTVNCQVFKCRQWAVRGASVERSLKCAESDNAVGCQVRDWTRRGAVKFRKTRLVWLSNIGEYRPMLRHGLRKNDLAVEMYRND